MSSTLALALAALLTAALLAYGVAQLWTLTLAAYLQGLS